MRPNLLGRATGEYRIYVKTEYRSEGIPYGEETYTRNIAKANADRLRKDPTKNFEKVYIRKSPVDHKPQRRKA